MTWGMDLGDMCGFFQYVQWVQGHLTQFVVIINKLNIFIWNTAFGVKYDEFSLRS
jgi:hypothetical protein